MSKPVVVTGAFDDLRSRDVRLFQEAARLGPVIVLLFPDELIRAQTETSPKFPWAERIYLLKSLRFVTDVMPFGSTSGIDALPDIRGLSPAGWIDAENSSNPRRRLFCQQNGLEYRVFTNGHLAGFPQLPFPAGGLRRKKVIVTGCYDWLHSGHVRFFEEVSTHGDLYVVVGHDANIRLLKGQGHPLQSQDERRYMVGAVRYVTQALVSSGNGWLDAEPEIQRIKPDIYAVNEDGDRGGKREYCAKAGLEYLVLKRVPAPGLPARSSTDLRGF
ncbi:MAG TPA: adenylyltransferase/cytidyltransferase family protein [Verrucomicrobiae bacterium]|nr:adenylyltransferase/cytidyltransferase family protein [Verrucomicrobiae bacterium]